MMAEMLSYLDSKSSAWVLEDSGAKSYPGEYTCHISQKLSWYQDLNKRNFR